MFTFEFYSITVPSVGTDCAPGQNCILGNIFRFFGTIPAINPDLVYPLQCNFGSIHAEMLLHMDTRVSDRLLFF